MKQNKELDNLFSVDSSNISKVGHHGLSAFVEFKNGNVYKYNDVGIELVHELAKAESVGKMFAQTLKNHQDFEKLEDVVLTKRKPSDEELENELIQRLRHFSENKMHTSSTGVQRMVAKRIIQYVKENT